ncbi:hypothetical protein [Haloactinomyces albus]|uniref:Uncharacterized protein n=1 Tax=Haloactinomyces albus TaxID=1352928 RepID=A0AAE3Z8T3_9ACTN|nr:hypothetical protein [Haloactinomyces albus]MDR7300441.1 hypothetical protein [Haloactinomyces albus]
MGTTSIPSSGALLYRPGIEVGRRASVFTEDGRSLAHCSSAVDAQEMFSLIRRVRLVWISAAPAAPAAPAEMVPRSCSEEHVQEHEAE